MGEYESLAGKPLNEREVAILTEVENSFRQEGIEICGSTSKDKPDRNSFVTVGFNEQRGMSLNPLYEENGRWLRSFVWLKENSLAGFIKKTIRAYRRNKNYEASRMASIQYPCFYDMHIIALKWLEHEKIDFRHAFQHDGDDLAEEFKAEVNHTSGNWGAVDVGNFSIKDGYVDIEGIGNSNKTMMFFGGQCPRLRISCNMPDSVISSLAGRKLNEVISVPFLNDEGILITGASSTMQKAKNRKGKLAPEENAVIIEVEDKRVALDELPDTACKSIPHWM